MRKSSLSPFQIEWLRLALIPEIGPRRGKQLLERFGLPAEIFAASQKDLASVVGDKLAWAIGRSKENIDLNAQLNLIEKFKVKIITLNDTLYPQNLRTIFDPPLVLFLRGEILPSDDLSIAIVGTRMATIYGMNMAGKITSQLVQKGITIISGGARGIDSVSHQAALRLKGRTIAVLGCGVDVVYPSENAKLFERIIQNGALVSEFPMGTKPNRQNFPQRNRIISGLALGVVIIEAPQKSGALITASCGLEQGREVFSVPGRADSFTTQGTHQLLRDGAKLVESADDIIEELEPILKNRLKEFRQEKTPALAEKLSRSASADNPSKVERLTADEERVYRAFCAKPMCLEDIAITVEFPINKIMAILTGLEIKGLIREKPGKVFCKNE